MAGILGIYGMIVAVIIVQKSTRFFTQSQHQITLKNQLTLIWLQDYAVASVH